jgi:co-chaperonin GroES (HSP10)
VGSVECTGLFLDDGEDVAFVQHHHVFAVELELGAGILNETTGVRNPIDLKAGDKVLYGKYAGTEFKLDGEDVMMLDEGDILAVIEK